MKMRTKYPITLFLGLLIASAGSLKAQVNFGSFYHSSSSESDLYKPVEAKLKIPSVNFRKGNEDAGEPSYSSYSPEMTPVEAEQPAAPQEEPDLPAPTRQPEKAKVLIPPPPIEESKPVEAPRVTKKAIPSPPPVETPAPKIAQRPDPPKMAPKVETVYDPPARRPVAKKVDTTAVARPVVPTPAPVARYDSPQSSTRISTPVVPPATYPPAQISPPETYHSAAPSVNRYPGQPMVQATPVSPGIGSPMVHAPDCPLNHGNVNSSSVAKLREVANQISRQGIPFRFGRSHPAFGGLDSSGAVQYLLNEIGVPGVPRTTGGLHSWVRVNDQIREFAYRPSVGELATCLVPGNLVFWGDQYSGRLTHVMVYLGYDARRDRHLAFGTRGGTEVGINGSEVDIFTLKLDREKIVATGRIPGL